MGISSFPVTGDTRGCDGEYIIETGSGNYIGIVIELCVAIAIFC